MAKHKKRRSDAKKASIKRATAKNKLRRIERALLDNLPESQRSFLLERKAHWSKNG